MPKTKYSIVKMSMVMFCVLFVVSSAIAQPLPTKTYNFGAYSVKTGYCAEGTSIEILKGKKRIYYNCGGDGAYGRVDTITLNNDSLPDFVYSYLDEYADVELLVSCNQSPYYKCFCLGYYFDPPTYDSSVKLRNGETIETFAMKDVNKDGKKDVLCNVLKRKGKHYTIKNWTDTFYYADLKQIAEGKPYETHSKAIFLGKEQNMDIDLMRPVAPK